MTSIPFLFDLSGFVFEFSHTHPTQPVKVTKDKQVTGLIKALSYISLNNYQIQAGYFSPTTF